MLHSTRMVAHARWFLIFSLATALACGGGNPEGSASSSCGDDANAIEPFVTPLEVHTGFNGRDNYQAVLSANFGTFTVTSRNTDVIAVDSFGCIESGEEGIMTVLTATGSGSARVIVSSGGFLRNIGVTVTEYSTADYDLGEERYNSPQNANGTDRIACNECHREGAGGAPHSPLSLAGNSDVDLVAAITDGQYPGVCEDDDGALCDCTPSGESCDSCSGDCSFNDGYILDMTDFGGGMHEFDLTSDEVGAINAYMRAIRPDGI